MILSDQQQNHIIHTKFGKANIYGGYYYIISTHKLLHRLIFEDFYNMKIPKGYVIHHKNHNPLDNCILNLQLMKNSDHIRLHNTGLTRKQSLKARINNSKSRNSTGYFNVVKEKDSNYKQGFCWKYRYYKNNVRKCLKSTSIDKLKDKVISKGLDWIEY